jgi:DNA-binding response OmpR family regulator
MSQLICIIEDDESIQDVLNIILTRAGFETLIYSDGHVVMNDAYTAPQLFLVDKQLPGVDGIGICMHLKSDKFSKNIPVIMMSAFPNIMEMSLLAGADDYIEKPFDVDTLLTTIRKHILSYSPAEVPV